MAPLPRKSPAQGAEPCLDPSLAWSPPAATADFVVGQARAHLAQDAALRRRSPLIAAPTWGDRARAMVRSRPTLLRQLGFGLAAFLLLDVGAVTLASDASDAGPVAIGTIPTQLGSAEAAAIGSPPEPQPLPAEIAIPAIKVHSPLVDLHVVDGELSVPADYAKAGWWTEGVVPGQVGPAIVVGHVDSKKGAAVFYRARQLRPGDLITITRADTSTITFKVDAVQQFAKATFPTRQIYGPTLSPTLRLITCGGKFNRADHHYEDNVIVFATILSPAAAAPPAPPAAGASS